MTVEGERDDICAVGQTMAAHDLCSDLAPYMRTHHLQAGVGHYGVFARAALGVADLPAGAQLHPGAQLTARPGTRRADLTRRPARPTMLPSSDGSPVRVVPGATPAA